MPCEKYFGGLLPESEEAKRAIGKNFGANPRSTFSLLRAIGHDCAGAVSFHDPEDPVVPDSLLEPKMKPLSEPELERHIKELPLKPLFMGVEGLRLSLAGVQEKAAVCVLDDKIAIPLGGTPTTHILKPSISKYPGSVQNEYLCLRTATRLGLAIPDVRMGRAGKEDYLLVERYDRKFDGGKRIIRLHQEDFCQALGIPPDHKYQNEGGPSLKQCFSLVRELSGTPVIDLQRLLDAVIFNFLVGNHDAHGKNFSLLHHGATRLAPLYDVLSTACYPELTRKMAMKIGGEYVSDKITPKQFEQLADEAGLAKPMVKRRVPELAGAILSKLPALAMENPNTTAVARLIQDHCTLALIKFKDTAH